MSLHRRLFVAASLAVALVSVAAISRPLHAQDPGSARASLDTPDEAFEVASVKPNRSGREQWDFDAAWPRRRHQLRHLLAERFALRVRYEAREQPAYALVLAR